MLGHGLRRLLLSKVGSGGGMRAEAEGKLLQDAYSLFSTATILLGAPKLFWITAFNIEA